MKRCSTEDLLYSHYLGSHSDINWQEKKVHRQSIRFSQAVDKTIRDIISLRYLTTGQRITYSDFVSEACLKEAKRILEEHKKHQSQKVNLGGPPRQ